MIINKIISLPRNAQRGILILSDTVLVIGAIYFSFALRLGYFFTPAIVPNNQVILLILLSPIIAIPIFSYFRMYHTVIRYISSKSNWSMVKAIMLYSILWGLLSILSGGSGFPLSVLLINFMVALICVGGSRMIAQFVLIKFENTNQKIQSNNTNNKILIYGAGSAGRQLAVALNHSPEYDMCGFIDDNKALQGRELIGNLVISIGEADYFAKDNKITDIFLAIPSITREERNVILKSLLQLKVRIKTLPGLSHLSNGNLGVDNIIDLDLEDLLMRDTVNSDEEPLNKITKGKVVMVTGAGGSIGSEICRQIVKRSPKIILLLEISEYSLYKIHKELENICYKLKSNERLINLPKIIPALGSVQDEKRITELIETWNPDILYHAAAYKHVPIVEKNLSEGIKNNVLGTLVLVKVAIEQGLNHFVLISTDKAVKPTNAMGASKRVAELILQAIASEDFIVFDSNNKSPIEVKQNTSFSMVRFGNVLGSSGSVVPLFREQISRGGPVTLTHKDITRYFMTISEASKLVMHAAAMTDKNKNVSEVYLLDMGKPIKIFQLAKRMIELSGLQVKDETLPHGDIEIKITGLRKGEKLYEELLIGNNPIKTGNSKIFKANEEFIHWDNLKEKLQILRFAVENKDQKMIVNTLEELVTGYNPQFDIADLVYKEKNK
jgi:FlaA1/EpsC-like NDP-sugar epimerase